MLKTTLNLRSLYRLVPSVQHYDWGGTVYIPALLQQENPEGRPFAELWMGAHPNHPSLVRTESGDSMGLDKLIGQNPEIFLGHETSRDFGGLPFLLKLLDVAKPLSMQVHPGQPQAQQGYDAEESRRVPRNSLHRNYKDPHHKPELVMALEGPFWVLAGFRPLSEINDLPSLFPEIAPFFTQFNPTMEGLKNLYGRVLSVPSDELNKLVRPLLDRWQKENDQTPFSKEDRRYWGLKAHALYSSSSHVDRGLLPMFFMNLVRLNPGEALYIPPGLIHSFLEGIALEISANSDNVLRAGLTHKHVDVAELLKTVCFEEKSLEIVPGVDTWEGESLFATEAREFELRRMSFRKGESRILFPHWSGQILFVWPGEKNGGVDIETDEGPVRVLPGESVFVPRGGRLHIQTREETVVFRVGTRPVDTFRGRTPVSLSFGTSGLRGRVDDITDLEAFVNTRGFMRFVKGRDRGAGQRVFLGMDLRPSSPRIADAVHRAVQAEGGRVEFMGRLPSPALMAYATAGRHPSVMVTGSHIPFDRNGIKFNLAEGEVLKEDESKILAEVRECRAEEYNRPTEESFFDDEGNFKEGDRPSFPIESRAAREAYIRRYIDFFPAGGLRDMKIVVYQHSAVARDLLVEILREFGARVYPVGQSDAFVPMDTEDVSEDRLSDLQRMADETATQSGPIDALVSTDGDSDRPLICGTDLQGALTFFPGDLVGPLVAEYLGADGVVVPVSANDVVEEFLKGKVLPRTKIGSPYVIRGMRAAADTRSRVVGYEANGGFLVQNEIKIGGRRLTPLLTRDAVLPILSILFSARQRGLSLLQLFDRLPHRFTKAGLLDHFPKEVADRMIHDYCPTDPRVKDVYFFPRGEIAAKDALGQSVPLDDKVVRSLGETRKRLQVLFHEKSGFLGGLVQLNCLDGLRIRFGNGDVVHLRPSGNAPQIRLYACANTLERAKEIVRMGLQKPHGFLQILTDHVGGQGGIRGQE